MLRRLVWNAPFPRLEIKQSSGTGVRLRAYGRFLLSRFPFRGSFLFEVSLGFILFRGMFVSDGRLRSFYTWSDG